MWQVFPRPGRGARALASWSVFHGSVSAGLAAHHRPVVAFHRIWGSQSLGIPRRAHSSAADNQAVTQAQVVWAD